MPGKREKHVVKDFAQNNSLPWIHLDLLYRNPDKTSVFRQVFRERLQKAYGFWTETTEKRWKCVFKLATLCFF